MHDQTAGGQTVFTGLAGVHECFTVFLPACPMPLGCRATAVGGQDVNCVLLDDTEDSVIIVYNQTSVGRVVFTGLAAFAIASQVLSFALWTL